ncbi:hypothetical protein L1887_07524 [Cichorium endivia]|nr:hypothetical protein L1887_07524 [Cichorium endivia]
MSSIMMLCAFNTRKNAIVICTNSSHKSIGICILNDKVSDFIFVGVHDNMYASCFLCDIIMGFFVLFYHLSVRYLSNLPIKFFFEDVLWLESILS